MPTNSPTIDIKKFLGIRNTGQSRRLPNGALETAQNVDVDDEYYIVSRAGYVSALTMTNVTAAYTPLHENFTYFVDNGVLYRVDSSLNKYALGNVTTNDVHWAEAGNKVFMSTGFIVEGDKLIPWSVQPPDNLLCRVSGGYLRPGRYMVLATVTSSDGRESATNNAVLLEIEEGEGIQIDNAVDKNIYITEPDGDIFYYAGTGISNIQSVVGLSIPCVDDLIQSESLPDKVDNICFHDNCILASDFDQVNNQTTIYRSRPYKFHVFDQFKEYVIVPGEVRLIVSTGNTLVIGTDREIYAGGEMESLKKVANYGVPHGHQSAKSPDGDVLIYTNRGPCECEPFSNLTEDKVSLPPGNSVSTAIIESRGVKQFIILTDGEGTANNKVN